MKNVSIYPLKISPSVGGILASLGIKGAMPIQHGSQGCTAFAVAMLTRHFREVVPIQTTALSEIATVMGDDFNLHESIVNVIKTRDPDLVVILSTAVSEVRGDDIDGSIVRFRQKYPELSYLPILSVSTPDFKGSLEDGFFAVVNKVVNSIPKWGRRVKNQINIITSPFLTGGYR
ncbi:MAG: hypothetical protein N2Z80_00195 [Hydrogenothermaceae bacterium]|nr:hypothetical protein [Hydrogenothermaceae bacterium]